MILPVRQYRCRPASPDPYDESSFGHIERSLEADPATTALITVDLWNMGWADEPLVPELGPSAELWFLGVGARAAAEAKRRTIDNLAPALRAARQAGLTVIHSNAAPIVKRYPECAFVLDTPASPGTEPDWPPPEVGRSAWDEYFRHTFGEDAPELWERMRQVADFPEPVRPVPGDYCVFQQAAVDALLRRRGITTVIHAGFLLGHCLQDNVGGLRSLAFLWRSPGYRDVVLRDCTLAQEYHSTIDGFRATEVFITWLEATGIPTAVAADLVAACGEET